MKQETKEYLIKDLEFKKSQLEFHIEHREGRRVELMEKFEIAKSNYTAECKEHGELSIELNNLNRMIEELNNLEP